MIFGWIFAWGIVWLLIVLAGPFVAYLEAGDRARRKYEPIREADEERMQFLKSIYMGSHDIPPEVLKLEEKPKKLSRRQEKRLLMKTKKKEAKRIESH